MSIFKISADDLFEKTAGLPKKYFTRGRFDPAKAAAETDPGMKARIQSYLAGKDIGLDVSGVRDQRATRDRFKNLKDQVASVRAAYPLEESSDLRKDLAESMKRRAGSINMPAGVVAGSGLDKAKTHAEVHQALGKLEDTFKDRAESAHNTIKMRLGSIQRSMQDADPVKELRKQLKAPSTSPSLADRLAAIKATKKAETDSAARRVFADKLRSQRRMRNIGLAVGIPALAGLGYYAYKKLKRPTYEESLEEFKTSRSGAGDNK